MQWDKRQQLRSLYQAISNAGKSTLVAGKTWHSWCIYTICCRFCMYVIVTLPVHNDCWTWLLNLNYKSYSIKTACTSGVNQKTWCQGSWEGILHCDKQSVVVYFSSLDVHIFTEVNWRLPGVRPRESIAAVSSPWLLRFMLYIRIRMVHGTIFPVLH